MSCLVRLACDETEMTFLPVKRTVTEDYDETLPRSGVTGKMVCIGSSELFGLAMIHGQIQMANRTISSLAGQDWLFIEP